MLNKFDLVVFANEREDASKTGVLREKLVKIADVKNKKIACVVGSEGGFCDSEIEAISKKENVVSISLGSRILRSETASVVLPTIILYEAGEI